MSKQSDNKNLEAMRHSAAHVLAQAVLEMFPEAKLSIGPTIENGFYYDFELPRTLIPEDLPLIEKKMQKIIKADQKFEKHPEPRKKAIEFYKKLKQPYKVELIEELSAKGGSRYAGKEVTFYKNDNFVDLCKGPHLKSTGEIGPFKLTSIAGAYFKGDPGRPMLQRIYGVAFATQKELDDYLKQIEEAKKNDHRKIGKKLDLFSFHEEGPGFPFWHPKGTILWKIIEDYWHEVHKREGYLESRTPVLLRENLWHQSGHYDHYRDFMYFTKIDKQKYALKPMNCPGGLLIYKSRNHSYREFPLKIAELGLVHRHELAGVLHGLFRVRSFTQDDAHVYCLEEQIEDEVIKVIKLTLEIYKKFGFKDYRVELSTRPKKSIGTDAMWDKAEKSLANALKKENIKYDLNPGDGAFYGPKIDFHILDSMGRSWQMGTIQLDFSMPDRFELEYDAKDGKKKRPIMIHRAIFGSFERFVGILLEHYKGNLPLWLAPVQAMIIPIADKHLPYAKKVLEELKSKNVRVEIDQNSITMQKKIKNAEELRIPLMLIVGDKEMKEKKVAVRSKEKGDEGMQDINNIIEKIN
ncbi:threonine--tRNA ligase [Patescibacteria group bacterium]